MRKKRNMCFFYFIDYALNHDKLKRHHYMSSHYNSEVSEKEKLSKEHNIEIPGKLMTQFIKIEKLLDISINVFTFNITQHSNNFKL